jgi:hypothetical protein
MSATPPLERRQLQRLLSKDEDELLILLAQTDPANSGVMFSAAEAREEGLATYERLLGPIRRRICDEWDYCSRRDDAHLSDSVTLAAAVADLVSTVIGGIPAATVAALVVKRGLSALCGCS